jgi:hypothetical protein
VAATLGTSPEEVVLKAYESARTEAPVTLE